MVRLFPLAALGLLAACNNPCQAVCVEMAQYADECGYTVSPDEVQACRDANAGAELDNERAQQCIEANDPQKLREWWTCDELLENYENAAP